MVETIKKKNQPKEKQNWRKRESIDLFVVDNLEKIGERGVNEVIKGAFGCRKTIFGKYIFSGNANFRKRKMFSAVWLSRKSFSGKSFPVFGWSKHFTEIVLRKINSSV